MQSFFELQSGARDAGRLPGLARLPAVWVSRLESGFRIPRCTRLEFRSFGHTTFAFGIAINFECVS
jgi:hypothetical protein